MNLEHLIYDTDGDGIATVTVNREEVLNSLSDRTIEELAAVFAEAAGNDAVRALILTGAGSKAFVSGADISEIAEKTPTTATVMSQKGQAVFRRLETMGKPSVAAINGYALGGGLELAMACSIRIAAEHAKLGLPEVSLGVIPGYAGTQRLARIVGRGVATDMIITGRPLGAEEALRVGLVSSVVASEDLMAAARKTVTRILRNGPLAIRSALEALDYGLDNGFEAGCKLEASLFGLLCATEDTREGLSAFLEKRKAEFKGK